MVGRQSKWETHTTEYLSPETSHLKAKNVELAKALAESKTLYAQALRERDYFQKQFFSASLRVTKLEAYIDKIDAAAQSTINTLVKLSDYATEIVRYTNISKVPINIDKSLHSLSPISSKESISSEHKTQAVKPMISGHVILRPTVNLRRVNEISIEEIQRLQSDNNSAQRTEDILRGNAVQQNVNEIDDELIDQPLNSSDVEFERNSHFFSLDTIAEDQESHLNINIPMNNRQSSSASNRSSVAAISLPTTSAQLPLLSGVFKEVRVYLSPMDSHSNITRARGTGGRSLVKTSSESQSSHSNKNVSLMSLNNNLNATEKNQSENRLDLMNAFRGASCTSTPVQTFTVNGNETPNFQNFYDCNNGNINNSDLANDNKKWLEEQRQHTECCSYPKKHIFSRPSNNTLSNIDCDPLEGPSNLLDTINSHKLEVLSKLGLISVRDM
ncbi:hypothetical protein FQA39_LY00078 [Lamprigera yunnana]|nr:hypothetical protein FQA39_LY00078 [Lamprigera yunnana]